MRDDNSETLIEIPRADEFPHVLGSDNDPTFPKAAAMTPEERDFLERRPSWGSAPHPRLAGPRGTPGWLEAAVRHDRFGIGAPDYEERLRAAWAE